MIRVYTGQSTASGPKDVSIILNQQGDTVSVDVVDPTTGVPIQGGSLLTITVDGILRHPSVSKGIKGIKKNKEGQVLRLPADRCSRRLPQDVLTAVMNQVFANEKGKLGDT